MVDRKKQPVAQRAYNKLAESYAQLVDSKPHNAYYERPATLSLLSEVDGKNVLDVGCGPGAYSEWLVLHGAAVVAFDANRKMVKLARRRLAGKAKIILADLQLPLDFARDASFDLIVAPLVMDYVQDWLAVFREFYRVLVPRGFLVFSFEHPFVKYLDHQASSNYFDIDLVKYTWHGFGTPVNVPSYRRPLNAVLNPLIRSGFILDQILEPLPTIDFKNSDPQDYAELTHNPGFMCIRAIKAS